MKKRLASVVFLLAGVYGLLTLPPMYFLEERIGALYPPVITHPEIYYGFIGVGLAWQLVFFVIASDPVRFRPIMPAAIFEKFSFGIAVVVLLIRRAVPVPTLYFGCIDLIFGALFASAFFFTDERRPMVSTGRAGWVTR